ncbi:hypothetical protein AB0E12_27685 [Micromonospora chersina]|uniref:hypothetical protein n=1 Tax=Micromonospora chersina TaxID=47854 RepID=UPI0033ED0FB2
MSVPPPPEKPLRVMPWWLALLGLLVAVLLGWLLAEADRAVGRRDDDWLVLTDP